MTRGLVAQADEKYDIACFRLFRNMETRKLSSIFVTLTLIVAIAFIFFQYNYHVGNLKYRMDQPGIWSKVYNRNVKAKANKSIVILEPHRRRLILIYTNLFGNREWYHLSKSEAPKFAERCEYKNCEVTYDQNKFADSDAVVFHARDMPSAQFLRDFSSKSRPFRQRWAYFISENPINTPDRTQLNGLFNLTMTYKKESDVWLPYKQYHKLTPAESKPAIINYAEEKNKVPDRKLVMWISSHCGTLRDQYAKKLQEFVSIRVAGGCANQFKLPFHNCNQGGREACFRHIKEHKFYLSFENAFCDQYVTEKYWYNALEMGSVPIVLGAGPYNDPKVAIPGSFINVEDFATVKDLADYLNYLDKNDTAYNEYFKWKETYKLTDELGWPFPDIFTCELCKLLHTDASVKVYDRLSDFWSGNDCIGNDNNVKSILSKS